MFDQNSAFSMLQESLDSLARSGTIKQPIKIQPTTQLLGPESSLDSLGFVTFVTDIEDRMQLKLDKECYLVLNEIAQFNVNSPSLTADVLTRYMVKLAAD
jgi:acyl carrier protein